MLVTFGVPPTEPKMEGLVMALSTPNPVLLIRDDIFIDQKFRNGIGRLGVNPAFRSSSRTSMMRSLQVPFRLAAGVPYRAERFEPPNDSGRKWAMYGAAFAGSKINRAASASKTVPVGTLKPAKVPTPMLA